jgi:hypothetical protein
MIFLLLSTSAFAAGNFSSKSGVLNDSGIGKIRIVHELVGEPVSQPERVIVYVTCKGEKKEKRVGTHRMCIYEGHSLESGTKELTLKMYFGRVDPNSGETTCDQFNMKTYDFGKICKRK